MNARIDNVKNIRLIGTKNLYFLDIFSKDGGQVNIVLNKEQVEYLAEEIKQQEKIKNILESFATN